MKRIWALIILAINVLHILIQFGKEVLYTLHEGFLKMARKVEGRDAEVQVLVSMWNRHWALPIIMSVSAILGYWLFFPISAYWLSANNFMPILARRQWSILTCRHICKNIGTTNWHPYHYCVEDRTHLAWKTENWVPPVGDTRACLGNLSEAGNLQSTSMKGDNGWNSSDY